MKIFSTKCPHFGICSGCNAQDIYNPSIWNEILSYINDIDPLLQPNLFFGPYIESRLKAKLAIESNKGELNIGLYKEGTHDVVDIPHCLVHHASINKAANLVKQAIKKFGMSIYCQKTGKGFIRYLQFFVKKESGKVQFSLVVNAKDISEVKIHDRFFDYLYNEEKIFHSIWVNLNDKSTNVIFSQNWHHIKGDDSFWQKIDKLDFLFHPMSFCQSNLSLFEKLIQDLEEDNLVFGKNKENLLELYAGVGAIGLNLAHKSNNVTLVEKNPYSKFFFDLIKQKSLFANTRYICKDAADGVNYVNQNEIIIVDPPRKGIDRPLLEALKNKNSGKIIYISCLFKSFKRDSEELLLNFWKLKKVNGYLFFPGTNHVEVVGIFEKNLGERI